MLYIDTLILHNFKSFRHSRIRFSKGFNSIVGPNGSGKSNIFDAILFSLGELSQKRLRSSSAKNMISFNASKDEDGIKRGYIKVILTGDTDAEIVKSINSNNKVSYKLNGKHITRQELIEFLQSHRSNINEVNTIMQGEIQKFLSLNSKGLRELIDVAAGVKEFDEKKEKALKELEQVEIKIGEAKVLLNERMGFLQELEKEKNDALKYLELSNDIKSTNFSILTKRAKMLSRIYEQDSLLLEEKKKKIESIKAELLERDMEISAKSKERENITKELNQFSSEISKFNKELEEINSKIAKIESAISYAKDRLEVQKTSIENLEKEKNGIVAKISENEAKLAKIKEELAIAEEKLKTKEAELNNELADEDYSRIQQEIEEKSVLGNRLLSEYEKLNAGLELLHRQKEELENIIDKQKKENEELAKRFNEAAAEANRTDKIAEELNIQLIGLMKNMKEENDKRSKIEAELINAKEQFSYTGIDSLAENQQKVLESNLDKNFYGRALDLCSFDDKYAMAISAAVGGRLNYFIVEDISTAAKAVSILKSRHMGRATFIPLKEVTVTEQDNDPAQLINFLKFEEKFRKAFAFISANTYITESIESARKEGLSRRRYATLDGTVIEPSNILSGGETKLVKSYLVLKQRIKQLNDEHDNIVETISSLQESIAECRTGISNNESERVKARVSLDYITKEKNKLEADIKKSEETYTEIKRQIEDYTAKLEKVKAEQAELNTSIAELKNRSKAYSEKGNEESKETARALRHKIEELKIEYAERSKENTIIAARKASIEEEIKRLMQEIAKSNASVEENSKELEQLKAGKAEAETMMKAHDSRVEEVYGRISAIEKEIATASFEKGGLERNRENLERETIEIEARISQTKTRISDINAELAQYPESTLIKDKDISELEAELANAKKTLESLGNVNLKAPELYDEKKKSAEEISQKLNTLVNEKSSIIEMIANIDSRKQDAFIQTFNEVSVSFSKLYEHIFESKGSIYLSNPKDIFNSGLMFDVTKRNEKVNIDSYSGGEKSLVIIMLIFAIQTMHPMSFYILDEIDNSLDKENAKKLSLLIKELSKNSQFIVISHNDSMIANADTAIGITNNGKESKAVGIEIAKF
ncbi:MAG: AAA family ATPase [Candidatus Micrarchaeia archaeon]